MLRNGLNLHTNSKINVLVKGPNIKSKFTPVPNLYELYNRIDKYIKSLGPRAGTKTAFGWTKRYKHGFNHKHTEWKVTDRCNFEPNNLNTLRRWYS